MKKFVTLMYFLFISFASFACLAAERTPESHETNPHKCSQNHSVGGLVQSGQKLARQLGFPTANLLCKHPLVEEGVYRAITTVDQQHYVSMAYRANNLLETHLFDYSGDLYAKEIHVELTHFIRSPVPYISEIEMARQLQEDAKKILEIT